MRLKVTTLAQNYKISSRKQLKPVLLNRWQKKYKHNKYDNCKNFQFLHNYAICLYENVERKVNINDKRG